jgi:hypothetical protein
MCQHCRRTQASWLDTYRDEALCGNCVPDRDTPYGMAFVTVLLRADAQRLSDNDRNDQERRSA